MIIVKLGGSLSQSDTLVKCLNRVEQNYPDSAVVIVPGGGAFADQVRLAQHHWQFDDKTAHRMAILAMQQMALLFNGIKSNFTIANSLLDIQKQLHKQKIVIWSPDIVELDKAAIQASWDITSDSLAAWLAKALSARELVLVKSAIIDASLNLQQLANQNLVDKGFCDLVMQATFKIQVINQQNF
ncbi:MAG: aspartate/glutamate/uridylate kinase [Methylococcaceae bacterium NSP1-1]|nr:MAG: aspartate/glutamate/uridylate kinase [Methylococcaceae bacterium NSP1-1]